MPNYASRSYWDERYAADDGAEFDWYQGWASIKEHVLPLLGSNTDAEVMIPGCGNSSLPCALYDAGWKNVTGVDFSAVVVQQ